MNLLIHGHLRRNKTMRAEIPVRRVTLKACAFQRK